MCFKKKTPVAITSKYVFVGFGINDYMGEANDLRGCRNDIEDEIKKLPARQREAFLMRYWEDMDVAETAAAMGCSEGSVKTHCSRATHALAAALSARGIKL